MGWLKVWCAGWWGMLRVEDVARWCVGAKPAATTALEGRAGQ